MACFLPFVSPSLLGALASASLELTLSFSQDVKMMRHRDEDCRGNHATGVRNRMSLPGPTRTEGPAQAIAARARGTECCDAEQPSDEPQAATQSELRGSILGADMRLLAKERIMMRKIEIWSGRHSSDNGSLFSRGPLRALFSRIRSCCAKDGASTSSLVAVPVSLLAGDGIRWGGSRNEKASFNLR